MAPSSVIPAGYTFLNPATMITTKGKDIADDLLKKANDRDPDAFDMYIYNDFFAYAVFDLVDKTLTNLNAKVAKKDWNEAYSILEALTVFNDYEGVWTQCDDGDRVDSANNAYGALAVAVLRALKKEGRLNATAFPSLESCLKGITAVGEAMGGSGCDSEYASLSRGIARRLFKDKNADDFALDKKRREEWVKNIKDKEEKEVMEKELKDLDKEGNGKPWYMKGKVCDEDEKNREFTLSRVWREYKSYLAGVPKGPMRGPSWDINKWSADDKKQFQFDNMEDSDF